MFFGNRINYCISTLTPEYKLIIESEEKRKLVKEILVPWNNTKGDIFFDKRNETFRKTIFIIIKDIDETVCELMSLIEDFEKFKVEKYINSNENPLNESVLDIEIKFKKIEKFLEYKKNILSSYQDKYASNRVLSGIEHLKRIIRWHLFIIKTNKKYFGSN